MTRTIGLWLFSCLLVMASWVQGGWAQTTGTDLAKKIEELEKRLDIQEKRTLDCKAGESVQGETDRWSPYSKCPAHYQATGLQRVDILGDHKNPINHVNDFQCNEQGCKAWCIGGGCTVQARCCRL